MRATIIPQRDDLSVRLENDRTQLSRTDKGFSTVAEALIRRAVGVITREGESIVRALHLGVAHRKNFAVRLKKSACRYVPVTAKIG